MSSDQYLRNVLSTYQVNQNLAEQYKSFFEPYIREWAKDLLVDLKVSGSIRKGTAVSNGTDVDLFLYRLQQMKLLVKYTICYLIIYKGRVLVFANKMFR
jgi:tRNA nucleotidyltransferase (CCA-adding enzyme)